MMSGPCWYELVPDSRRRGGDPHDRQAASGFSRRGSDAQQRERSRRRAHHLRTASAHSDMHASPSPEHLLLDVASGRHTAHREQSHPLFAARSDTIDVYSGAPKWKSSASIEAESRRPLPPSSDPLHSDADDRWQQLRGESPALDDREAQLAAAQRFRRKLPSLPDPLNTNTSNSGFLRASTAPIAAPTGVPRNPLPGAVATGPSYLPRNNSPHQLQQQLQQQEISSTSGSCCSAGGWTAPLATVTHAPTGASRTAAFGGHSSAARSRRQLSMAARSNTLTAYDVDVRERADEADLPDTLRRVGSEGVAMNALEHIGQHASAVAPSATLVNSSLNSSTSNDQWLDVDEPPVQQTRAVIAAAATKTKAEIHDSLEDLLGKAAQLTRLESADEDIPLEKNQHSAIVHCEPEQSLQLAAESTEIKSDGDHSERQRRTPDPEAGVNAITPSSTVSSEAQPFPAIDRRRARGGVTRKISQVVFGRLGLYKKSRSSSQLHLGGVGAVGSGASGRCSFQRSQEVGSVSAASATALAGGPSGGSAISTVPEAQNFVEELGPGQVVSRSALGSSPLGELDIRLFGVFFIQSYAVHN